MAQTPEGADKVAAAKAGVTLGQYQANIASGLKWCTKCREWHPRGEFGVDLTRYDDLAASCLKSRRVVRRRRRVGGPATPQEAQRAVDAVRFAVRRGELPPVDTMDCEGCGDPAKHYHHHKGYAPEHLLDVKPLCVGCHQREHFD